MTQDQPGDKDRTAGPEPVSGTKLTGRESPRTDRVVFGVTAVLTVAFVVWAPRRPNRSRRSRAARSPV
ncbi:hypothetical protein ACR6C2_41315 [Streptomyces sp. INA 01156]